MTQTSNLDLALIAPGQTNKHLTANNAFAALEETITEEYASALVGVGDHTLPFDETEGGDKSGLQKVRYRFTGTPGGAVNVIHPDRKHLFFVHNDTPTNIVFKTAAGTGPTIAAGEVRLCYCDGTDVDEVGVTAVVGSLNSITDVDIASPVDGSMLRYDDATSKWVEVTGTVGQILVHNGTVFALQQPYARATASGTTIDPVLTDINKLTELTAATAITVVLPLDATLDFPDNARLSYIQGAAGQITFDVEDVAVTLRYPAIFTPSSLGQWAIVHAIKIGDNEWLLSGALELA